MEKSDNTGATNDNRQVKSVLTLFSILEHLKENDGMGVTELSKELEMSKGAVHRYLKTLINAGYALNEDGTYKLGLRFLGFGSYVRDRYPINHHIQPKVKQLAEETGERCQYIVEEHGQGIYLHRERGQHAVQTDARVGKIVYLHTTAAGKAILSQLPHKEVDAILDRHGLVQPTNDTVGDRKELHETLAEIRERGYALNRGEHVSGLYAIGAPIVDEDDTVLGGISISGPENRIKSRIEKGSIQQTLLGTVDEIKLNLTYS
jgi:DNA-binding IclR family transcriptional regulator